MNTHRQHETRTPDAAPKRNIRPRVVKLMAWACGGLITAFFFTRLMAWGLGVGLMYLTTAAYGQAAAYSGLPSATTTDPAIVRIAESYRKAVLAGDAAAVISLYRDDAIEMPAFQGPVVGRTAIGQFYRGMFNSPVKITGFTFSHIEATANGDVGYDVGTYKRSMTTPSGPIEVSGTYTVILKRTADEWKVAYTTYTCDCPPPGAPPATASR
jgi:uncharacterized protein (TIGR02246 family)